MLDGISVRLEGCISVIWDLGGDGRFATGEQCHFMPLVDEISGKVYPYEPCASCEGASIHVKWLHAAVQLKVGFCSSVLCLKINGGIILA